jgi:phospholipid N-methyltransferase
LNKSPSTSEQALLFARNFFKHPKMLGSLIPSSPFLTEKLLDQVDWGSAKVIVEYGPGVGNMTEAILKRMNYGARLVAIEMNQDFVGFLNNNFYDPRLHVQHGSAEDVDKVLAELGYPHADYVVSGIPYSTMPPAVRDAILRKTYQVLRPEGGAFIIYQFTRAVLPYLKQVFGYVQQDFEPLNILPARIFYCTR